MGKNSSNQIGARNLSTPIDNDQARIKKLLHNNKNLAEGEYLFGDTKINPSELPPILRDGCSYLDDIEEKEIFIVAALGILSGCAPNYHAFYDNKFYHPNLYCFILAPYGQGKSSIMFAKQLADDIHKQRKGNESIKNKGEENIKDEIEKPSPPKLLFIPANITKPAVIELLDRNIEGAIICESEADTLSQALNDKQGQFSDILRNAFQHEEISFYRRGNSEYKHVSKPKLSVVIAGTPDQLQKLIPKENGLQSRFLYYQKTQSTEFRNVFSEERIECYKNFEKLSVRCLELYNGLLNNPKEILFKLTKSQEEDFVATLKRWKKNTSENISGSLAGSVNRIGLICFRICMVLTVLRHEKRISGKMSTPDNDVLHCEDIDFKISTRLTLELLANAADLFIDASKNPVNNTYNPKYDKGSSYRGKGELTLDELYNLKDIKKWSFGKISKAYRIEESTIKSRYYRNKIENNDATT